MIQTSTTHFIGSKDCRYTLSGRKLTEYRRAQLRPLAKKLKVDDSGTKNDILRRIISKLDVIGAEAELGNIGQQSQCIVTGYYSE